jgi:hypothetical protein
MSTIGVEAASTFTLISQRPREERRPFLGFLELFVLLLDGGSPGRLFGEGGIGDCVSFSCFFSLWSSGTQYGYTFSLFFLHGRWSFCGFLTSCQFPNRFSSSVTLRCSSALGGSRGSVLVPAFGFHLYSFCFQCVLLFFSDDESLYFFYFFESCLSCLAFVAAIIATRSFFFLLPFHWVGNTCGCRYRMMRLDGESVCRCRQLAWGDAGTCGGGD